MHRNEINDLLNKENQISENFGRILKILGCDTNDPNLKDTPRRVARMLLNEVCGSLQQPHPPKLTSFPLKGHRKSQMVILKDLQVHSLCAHHFLPFTGVCHVAYIPESEALGLSKFSRIVDWFSRKPQLQEDLTFEIGNFMKKPLKTDSVAVIVKCEHQCMKLRGVKEPCSETITSYVSGQFENPVVRAELLNLLQL